VIAKLLPLLLDFVIEHMLLEIGNLRRTLGAGEVE
jgi:hypothetical protein